MRYQSRASARFRDTVWIIYKRAITIAIGSPQYRVYRIYRREINAATRIKIKSVLSLGVASPSPCRGHSRATRIPEYAIIRDIS